MTKKDATYARCLALAMAATGYANQRSVETRDTLSTALKGMAEMLPAPAAADISREAAEQNFREAVAAARARGVDHMALIFNEVVEQVPPSAAALDTAVSAPSEDGRNPHAR